MALEFEDHQVTKAEHEFYRAFVVILEHLKNRALKAEAEVRALRKELEVRFRSRMLGALRISR